MPQSVLIESLGETWEFPDEATPDQIKGAIGRQLESRKAPAAQAPQIDLNLIDPRPPGGGPSMSEIGRMGGSLIDPGDPREGTFTKALFTEAPGAAMTYVGNIARGAVADAAVGIRTLGETKKEAEKTSVESSGNLPAAIMGEPLPIDQALGDAAREAAQRGEFPTAAVVGQTSQGLAAMAPLAVVGFAPAMIQRLAALGFSADMIRHAPELFKDYAEEINKPEAEQDPDKLAKLTSGIAQTFAFAPLAGKHGVGKGLTSPLNPSTSPRTPAEVAARAVFEEAAKAELPNELITISQQKTPEVIHLERANAPMTAKVVESIQRETPKPEPPKSANVDTGAGSGQGGGVKPEKPPQLIESQYAPDEMLEMRSPHTGDVIEVSYRGPLGADQSVVWTGKSQMAIPTEWLSRSRKSQLETLRKQHDEASREAEAAMESIEKGRPLPPEYRAAEKKLDAITQKIKELERPEREAQEKSAAEEASKKRDEMLVREAKEIAEAETYQTRNGWEIVKRKLDYVLRDPITKEEVYAGKLSRVRQVADESSPTPPPPEKVETKPSNENINPQPTAEGGAQTHFSGDKNFAKAQQSVVAAPTAIPQKLARLTADAVIRGKLPDVAMERPAVEMMTSTVGKGGGESRTFHQYVTIRVNGKQVWRGTPNDFEYYQPLKNLFPGKLTEFQASGRSHGGRKFYSWDKTTEPPPSVTPPVTEKPKFTPTSEGGIFGYSWEQIKSAQQGGKLVQAIRGAPQKPKATQADFEMLERHGAEWLYENEKFGVIDRLGLPLEKPGGGEIAAKVRVGKNPTPHTVVERLPQSAAERANNEQPVKVRNDRTGEESVVMESDTTPIKLSETPRPKASASLDKKLTEAGLDPSVFPNAASKRAALRRAREKGQGSLTPAPLAPSTASPSTPVSVKSQRQMITDLSKALNLPIRFGRLTTSKYGGYFKEIANLIGIKKASDVPVAAHEAGHKLDTMFGLSKDPAIAVELDKLGDPSTPGSASSWTPSKTKSYKMGEGVAEFVRHWLTDPAKALADAPNTFAAFEKILAANKDLGDRLRQTQEDVQVWKNAPAQARLRAQISIGENPNKTRYTLTQLTRDLLDDLHILNRARQEAGDLAPSKDPYIAARNMRGSYGMADTFISKGVVRFKDKSVRLGSSLEDALKPVAGRLNDFRDWMVAKRAQELHLQKRETGILPADAGAVAAKFDAEPGFMEAFGKIKDWNDALLQYAVDAGLISKTSAKAMREMNEDYVPFHRVFEVGAGEAPSQQSAGIGMGLNVGKPGSLKSMTGSTRQIVDPLETMVKNAYSIITASEKAAINKSVADLANKPDMGRWVERIATPKEQIKVELDRIRKQLEASGADLSKVPDDLLLSFFKSSNKTPFGENVIRVIKDGEPEFYRLDRDLHDTFKALDLEDSSTAVRIISAPAQWLRAGVVLEPTFNLANAWRDAFGSAIISRHGTKPFEAAIRGFAAMIGNKKLVAEWAASGGKSSVEAAFFDRKKMQKFLAEKIAKDMTPAERATVWLKSPLTALRVLSSAFEEATRIGEYQKAYNNLTKQGMPPGEARRLAAFESRDRQDFAMGGAKTKIIRHMTPFWNAAMQGNYRLFKAFKERPLATMAKGLAYITSIKLAEQAINWNDEDYWDQPQWQRDAFFMIPNGKDESGHTKFIRLPIPFLPGVLFATIPGRILQYGKKNDPEALKTIMDPLLQEAENLFPKPTAFFPIYENFMTGPRGWDTFRNRQIVPERLIDLPPELQFTEQNSRAAKEIGKMFGISPMKVDHLIEQTTGGLGKLATGRARFGQRFQSAPLNVSSEVEAEFYRRLQEEESLKAQGKPSASVISTYAELISLKRKAERAATTEAEKVKIREEIFQLQKKALETDKAP